jgi:hypothetical protein
LLVDPCHWSFPIVGRSPLLVVPHCSPFPSFVVPRCLSFLLFVIPRCLLFPTVGHSPSLVIPHHWSFPAVGRSLPIVIPHHCSFPVVHCSHRWSFPLICHPSLSSSSAPPYLPMSSGSQAGWGCCVTWDWQWSSLDRKGPLPPCEQRLTAAAQGCIVRWVGNVTTGSSFPLEESTNDPPREQSLARLDISAVSFVLVVIENSSNNPPHE